MKQASNASIGQHITLHMPEVFADHYSEADKVSMKLVIDWLNSNKRSLTWIAACAHVNRSTLSNILKGVYPSPPSKQLGKVASAIHNIKERENISDVPFIESSVTGMVWMACKRARSQRSFAVITAEVGTGKTRSLKEYCANTPNSFLVEADPIMSPSMLCDDLIRILGIPTGKGYHGKDKKFRLIVDFLRDSDVLLILDEAETVNDHTLHYIRRIRDKSNVGIVLAGTPKLDQKISPIGGQFDQIRSRVMFWPKPIRAATKEDVCAVATAAFSDVVEDELDPAVNKALWHHCKGSMRMLTEGLIPAIRDFGLPQHKVLSADLVHAIARDVLSLDK